MLGPVGKVLGPRGLHGELRLRFFRADPSYLSAGRVFVGGTCRAVTRARWSDGRTAVVALDGIGDRAAAEALEGAPLAIDPAWFAPGEGPVELLVGAEAVDADTGSPLGLTVTGIDSNGAQDLLVLGEVLVPFVEALVPGVVVEDGRTKVRIRVLEGLLS